jgi:hypothetical protein
MRADSDFIDNDDDGWFGAGYSSDPGESPASKEEVAVARSNGANSSPSDYRGSLVSKRRQRQVGGAAALGGAAGLLLGGPVLGVMVAGGAAICAATPGKGPVRDATRATGEVVASAGRQLYRLDKKHRIFKTASEGVVNGCNWVNKKLQPAPRSTGHLVD